MYIQTFEGPAPPAVPSPPAPRPCCILAPDTPLGSNWVEIPSLGTHRGSNEANGVIYTGKAGFLDTGHMRDLCDLTKHIHDQIRAATGSPVTPISTTHGEASFHASLHTTIWVAVARAIAFDDSIGYEILTYDHFSPPPGGHNSSFSPEDLCSNFLGTLLAERAIGRGGNFNAAVTSELSRMLTDLAGQPLAETQRAFNRINGRWVNFTSWFSLVRDDYLRRRNFTNTPWKSGHSSDRSTPSWVTSPLPSFHGHYTYTHTQERRIPKSLFGREITRIRRNAASRYGRNYDKP